MKLDAETVNKTFLYCLFNEGEPTDNHVVAEAVRVKVGFHPERLKEKDSLIKELLDELPKESHKNSGGGMSFLQMAMDKDGNHWAEHKTMDELVALGIATGRLSFLMPRELWGALPGGMPYIVINSKEG